MTDEAVTPEAFFETLASHTGYRQGFEGRLDRYQDFRAVFLGSEQGRRVLHEILRQCGVNKAVSPAGPVDPYQTHLKEGRRGAALTIMGIIHSEPEPQPVQQTRKRSE